MKLREYQREAIDNIEGSLAFGSDKICLAAPTSFGKTITAATLIKELVNEGKQIVFMMNLTALIEQTAKTLDKVGVKYNVLAASWKGSQSGTAAQVTIAMQQTMYSRIDTLDVECDVLFIDEFHQSYGSDTMRKVINVLKPDNIIGLSGTPIDEKGFVLDGVEIIETATVKSLTNDGFLTPVNSFVTRFSQRVELPEGSAEWTAPEIEGVINNDAYNQGVVDAWLHISKYDNTKDNDFELSLLEGKLSEQKEFATIVFVSGIDHAESLAAKFNELGIAAKSYHSKITSKEREEIMAAHKRFEFPILVSVAALTTGYDFPEIRYGICCRPTKVLRLYLQMVGRIMRLSEGKDKATWIDAAKVTETHGFYDAEVDFTMTSKDQVEAQKKRNSIPEMNYISEQSSEDVIEINFNGVEAIKKKISTDDTLQGRLTQFDLSTDIRELLVLSSKINHLIGGQKISDKTIDWILEEVEPAIEEFGIKPFKTRLKNIIKQGKKPAGLRYFPEWLREQKGY